MSYKKFQLQVKDIKVPNVQPMKYQFDDYEKECRPVMIYWITRSNLADLRFCFKECGTWKDVPPVEIVKKDGQPVDVFKKTEKAISWYHYPFQAGNVSEEHQALAKEGERLMKEQNEAFKASKPQTQTGPKDHDRIKKLEEENAALKARLDFIEKELGIKPAQ